jgi:protein ImuB
MVIKAVSAVAAANGISCGTVVADARAIFPKLEVLDDTPRLAAQLLKALGEWCIRYSPIVSINLPDSLILDASGCTHLWGGEPAYLKDIFNRFREYGYHIKLAMADTIGAAWALAHFGNKRAIIIEPGKQIEMLMDLPPAALRLEDAAIEKLHKLGCYHVRHFLHMPRKALRRRFGEALLMRIDQAVGTVTENMEPLCPIVPYLERLPSLEPIRTATGIDIALRKLLEALCGRLEKEEKGIRKCALKTYRVDGRQQSIEIGTSRASRNIVHLFRLFEDKLRKIAPGLGIELFTLEAAIVEDLPASQEAIWNTTAGNEQVLIAELIDRIIGKMGVNTVHRYLPAEHHWPEHSIKAAGSLEEQPATEWPVDLPRPLHLLDTPEEIQVTVRIPDYPPMLFVYQGNVHRIKKADGPERIEREWWRQKGLYRDYYCVEDERGGRYWLFRLGHYSDNNPKWFIHGFFA